MLSDWNYNQFLLELDKQKHKTLYARIIALDLNESPIETIEGRVTQGSINIDGASAVRRTCSLTIIAQNFDYNNYLWGMNTKFKLEIGVVNTIDPTYPDIIWFKQGIYLITNFNVASSTNNFTISLQGKDKMCQLNGEVSGTLTQSVDFGTIEEETADGSAFVIRHLPIKDIIRNAVHQFGGEPFHNIIINDLEELGLELLEYRYDIPMYLYKLYPEEGEIEPNVFENAIIGGEVSNCFIDGETKKNPVANLNDLGAEYFMKLVDDMIGVEEENCKPIYFVNDNYYANPKEAYQISPADGNEYYYKDMDGNFQSLNETYYRATKYDDKYTYYEKLKDDTYSEVDKNILNQTVVYNGDYYTYGEIGKTYYTIVPEEKQFIAYKFVRIENGQTVGYRITDLTYPGDLLANAGDSITSVLDKIKNVLGEFEYFYDLDGKFTFQRKKSFINTLYSPIVNNKEQEQYVESLVNASSIAYTFSEGELISQFNNNPNLLNLRNDFAVWGERTTAAGAAKPIHLRYAIDKKPTSYKKIIVSESNESDKKQVEAYNQKNNVQVKYQEDEIIINDKDYDWREIIYQMAKDYNQYNFLEDFEIKVIEANPQFITGKTGYEQYYIDLISFWPELYNTEIENLAKGKKDDWEEFKKTVEDAVEDVEDAEKVVAEAKEALDNADINDPDYESKQRAYKSALKKLTAANSYLDEVEKELIILEEEYQTLSNKSEEYFPKQSEHPYFLKNVYEHPELLDFWFDFLDVEGELNQFSVKAVGSRPKNYNDTKIKSIYFRETPDVIFVPDITKEEQKPGYKYIQYANIDGVDASIDWLFSISSQGVSAKDKLDELIYNHSYCCESATITSVPIYHLEPNTRIYLYDEKTNLHNDYIIDKMTIPLAYNGMMTINATKAAETLL